MEPTQPNAVICFTTTANEKDAKKLALALVRERLAGVVQVIPKIHSYYEWDGAVQEEQELLLIIRTVAQKLDALKLFITQRHSYELPELVMIPINDGLPDYLRWLDEACLS